MEEKWVKSNYKMYLNMNGFGLKYLCPEISLRL